MTASVCSSVFHSRLVQATLMAPMSSQSLTERGLRPT